MSYDGYLRPDLLVRTVKHQLSTPTPSHSLSNQSGITEAIVTAIADAADVSPLDVDPPLATVIDPDALNTLVESVASGPDEPTATVEFPYNGYGVTVNEVGDVYVDGIEG